MTETKSATALLPVRAAGVNLTTLEDMQRMANIFIASGLFEAIDKEANQGVTRETKIAQALVKIQAGMELGIPPFTAMKDISIVRGKTQLSYQLILSKVRQTPGYDYKVTECTDNSVKIEFFRNKESLGVSTYDMDDAKRSGVTMTMYQKYPRNMLMARAASNGVNMYCPEVTRGSVYTPEDFGGESQHTEEVIEVTHKTIPTTTEELREASLAEEVDAMHTRAAGKEPPVTEGQIAELFAWGKFHGYHETDIASFLETQFNVTAENILTLTEREWELAKKEFSREKVKA
jgi:hypothetical protein